MKAEQRSRFLSSHKFWGLIVILPLLFTFITGSFAFVRNDLMVWAQPELATVKAVDLDAVKAQVLMTHTDVDTLGIKMPSEEEPRIMIYCGKKGQKGNR